MLSSLNAVISTNESTWFITGHMVYNLAYTLILQTTTTLNSKFEFIPFVTSYYYKWKFTQCTLAHNLSIIDEKHYAVPKANFK